MANWGGAMANRINKEMNGVDGKSIVLVILDAKYYSDTKIAIVKQLSNDGACGIYITLNKPYSSLLETFKKNKVRTDKLFFIDCVTGASSSGAAEAENVLYLDGLRSLTNLSLAIAKTVETFPGDKFFVLDALTTLKIYNSPETVSSFLHTLTSKMSAKNIGGAILSIEEETNPMIARAIEQFVDQIIDLTGREPKERRVTAEKLKTKGLIK